MSVISGVFEQVVCFSGGFPAHGPLFQ
jgi:hypothetical protein